MIDTKTINGAKDTLELIDMLYNVKIKVFDNEVGEWYETDIQAVCIQDNKIIISVGA